MSIKSKKMKQKLRKFYKSNSQRVWKEENEQISGKLKMHTLN